MSVSVGRVSHLKAEETIVKIAKKFENCYDEIFLADRNKKMIYFLNGSPNHLK